MTGLLPVREQPVHSSLTAPLNILLCMAYNSIFLFGKGFFRYSAAISLLSEISCLRYRKNVSCCRYLLGTNRVGETCVDLFALGQLSSELSRSEICSGPFVFHY